MALKNQKLDPYFDSISPAIVLAMAVALPAFGVVPGWGQTPSLERALIASAEPCLRLHVEPDAKSAPVRCLAPGRRMNLLASRDGWARVRLPDAQEGWVLFRWVRPAVHSQDAGVSAGSGGSESLESRQITKLESVLASAAIERAELQRGTSALRGEVYELRLANERLMASASERALEESKALRRIGELEAALESAEAQSRAAAEEALSLEQRIAALTDDALAGETRLAEVTARLEVAEERRSEAENARLEIARDLEVLRGENEALRERAAARQAEFEQGASALRSEIDQLGVTKDRLTAERATLATSLAQADGRIEGLEEAVALAEAGRSKREQESSELRSELERLRAANDLLKAESSTREDARAASISGSRLELLEEALGSLEAERLALKQANFELRSEVDRLRNTNEWLAMAAVERPASVSVARAVRREYEGALGAVESADDEVSPQVTPPPSELSPEPPREPPTTAPFELIPEARDATAAVEAWARAWSDQRVDDYLYFYADSFEPADASSREEWEALRRERVTRPQQIDVRIALADLRRLGADRLAVVFLQSYESDLLTDVVLKTLEMVREESGWKITAERVE